MCSSFIFKVNHQGQVIQSKLFKILDIVNVRNDTKTAHISEIIFLLSSPGYSGKLFGIQLDNNKCHVELDVIGWNGKI